MKRFLERADKPDGWWYPWIYVAGFLVVVAVNGVMLYAATSTFSGLETRDAYERGLAYNARLSEHAAQEQLGWQGSVSVLPAPGAQERLAFRLSTADGAPVSGLSVAAQLRHPTATAHDRMLRLENVGAGVYEAALDIPPGVWDIRIEARRAGHDVPFRLSDRLRVQ